MPVEAAVATTIAPDRIEAVRQFNRFYTKTIGLLPEGHLDTQHSLAEARVLYELAHRSTPTASEIADELGLDAGYMSRIVRRLEEQRLIARRRSSADGRQALLGLTTKGRARFSTLNRRAQRDVAKVLGGLSLERQERLTRAMDHVRSLLGDAHDAATTVLRAPTAGDFGWVVQRHGEVYAAEYGWNAQFEGLVARIVADFVNHSDPARERCWIADRQGERVGCVFLVGKSPRVAQLRLLLVDPVARGRGLGSRLVTECTQFARQAGYRKIVLWTQSILAEARRLYARHGYRLTSQEPHRSFGHDLIAETWELPLDEGSHL
jgi:DNA-binding MarR family transcriptional regulator/N-acetylglutamate synthase-like GNAT family acetyltransferase